MSQTKALAENGTSTMISNVVVSVVASIIVGAIVLYGQYKVSEAKIETVEKKLNNIDCKLDAWYEEHQGLKVHKHDNSGDVKFPDYQKWQWRYNHDCK